MKEDSRTKEQLIGDLHALRRRVAELEAAADNDQRYRMLIERGYDIAYATKPDGILTYISPQVARYGFQADQLVSRSFLEVIHPEDRKQLAEDLARSVRDEVDFPSEFRVVSPDGSVWWFEQRSTLQRDSRGGITGLIGTLRDITERKQLETDLRAAYARLEYLLTASPAVIYTAQAEGTDIRPSFVSENVQALFGYPAQEFLTNPRYWIDHLHPDDSARVLAELARLPDLCQLTLEYRFRHRDGEYRWTRDSMNLIWRGNERVADVVGFWIDITDRKQAEEAQRESEIRYRRLVESAPAAIGVVIDGRVAFANREAARIVGADNPEQLIGRPLMDFVHPDARAWIQQQIVQVIENGVRVPGGEVKALRVDGTTVDVEVAATAVSYQGRPAVQGIFRDITERQRIVRALQESEERYRGLVESATDGIGLAVDGKIAFLNSAGARLLGAASPASLLGKPILEVVHPSDRPRAELRMRELATHRQTLATIEEKFLREDGSVLEVGTAVTPVTFKNQPAIQIVFRDIADRKRLERALAEISDSEQRRIGRDLHDNLGQQLTGIAFLSKALQQKLEARSSTAATDAAEIARLASEMVAQAKDLAHSLHPVQMDAGGLAPSLQELAGNVQNLFHVRCLFQSAPPAPVLDPAAAEHLYRIAQEAVTNAVKHGQGHQIAIRLESIDGDVVLTIQDDGQGFRMAADTPHTLGLKIMEYRADAIGAKLHIQSRTDRGTTVTCTLPHPLPGPQSTA